VLNLHRSGDDVREKVNCGIGRFAPLLAAMVSNFRWTALVRANIMPSNNQSASIDQHSNTFKIQKDIP
jgi:hypothetical protein